MIYKVGILGATGRMGQEIASLLHAGFEKGGIVLEFCDAVANSKKLKSVDGVPVRLMTEVSPDDVHVWIDFSRPEATLKLLEVSKVPVVIGTTGFSNTELERVRDYAKRIPILLSANMSPGLNWLLKMLKVTKLPGKGDFDLVLSETHHKHKKDAPSGTLKTIQATLEAAGYPSPQVNVARAGEEKGTHTVSLFSDAEEIVLTHRVLDRKVFAKGSLEAALFLLKKNSPGLYSFQDLED